MRKTPDFDKFLEKVTKGRIIKLFSVRGVVPSEKGTKLLVSAGKEEIPYINVNFWTPAGVARGKQRMGDHYAVKAFIVEKSDVQKIVRELKRIKMKDIISVRLANPFYYKIGIRWKK